MYNYPGTPVYCNNFEQFKNLDDLENLKNLDN